MIGVFALALQVVAPAAGANATVAKWGIEYGPTRCLINRRFGDATDPSTLAVDADPVTGTGDLWLVVPNANAKNPFGTATLTVTPSGARLQATWFSYGGQSAGRTYKLTIKDADWKTVLGAETVSVEGVTGAPIAVPVGGIGKAVQAAKTCGRDLLHSWGADPDAMVLADPKIAITWILPDDYPVDALRAGQMGTAKVLVTIDSEGRPTGCRTAATSGVPSLDAATCRALTARARFGRSAMPVRYYYRRTIWRIP